MYIEHYVYTMQFWKQSWKQRSPEQVSRTFAKLMLAEKVSSAMRLLDESSTSGLLQLSEETLRELRSKHPEGLPPTKKC